MTGLQLGYQAVRSSKKDMVTSLIAYEMLMRAPLQAALQSVPWEGWIHNPDTGATFLFDPNCQDGIRQTDRAVAEWIARKILQTELPPGHALLEMFAGGKTMGWELRPP
jgi:hypothetical protein